jgi:DNA polymerase/3'-5' exonuclease PolX
VAYELVNALRPVCVRIEIAGSLRRHKPDVGDIEILYVPVVREEPDPDDLFATRETNLADGRIMLLERTGVLARRQNALGREMFGPRNKLMVHVASGIPVDLFATNVESWWNYLVCRTGPAESNTRIASAAKRMGWKWAPYSAGFARDGEMHRVDSESAVFAFVGLPYMEPRNRK